MKGYSQLVERQKKKKKKGVSEGNGLQKEGNLHKETLDVVKGTPERKHAKGGKGRNSFLFPRHLHSACEKKKLELRHTSIW